MSHSSAIIAVNYWSRTRVDASSMRRLLRNRYCLRRQLDKSDASNQRIFNNAKWKRGFTTLVGETNNTVREHPDTNELFTLQ